MKVRKNLEAVFLAAVVVATFASLASAAVPSHHSARHSAQAIAAGAVPMQVVVVKGKRLTAAEKATLN
ncbi:MAG: hypothetical protein V4463_08545 [Pseudomonadota bacterium]